MINKKGWLLIKGLLLLLLIIVIIVYPTTDNARKWISFIMLIFFTFSFIIDLNRYNKKND